MDCLANGNSHCSLFSFILQQSKLTLKYNQFEFVLWKFSLFFYCKFERWKSSYSSPKRDSGKAFSADHSFGFYGCRLWFCTDLSALTELKESLPIISAMRRNTLIRWKFCANLLKRTFLSIRKLRLRLTLAYTWSHTAFGFQEIVYSMKWYLCFSVYFQLCNSEFPG